MASVQYVHTQRFQAEVVSFIQHFTQLQDVLGRQRAAIEGQTVSLGFILFSPSLFSLFSFSYFSFFLAYFWKLKCSIKFMLMHQLSELK